MRKEGAMPNRMLREGILSSEAVNSLNWEEEVFYRRLMSVVDDYGRYDARPAVLRAALYGMKLDSMRENSVQRCLAKCEAARLLVLYSVDGKPYLELLRFDQRVRAKKSKYPPMPAGCEQAASASLTDDGHMTGACPTHDSHMLHGDGDGDGDEGESLVATLPCSSPPSAEEVRRVMGSLMLAPLKGAVLDECVERYMLTQEARGWCDAKGVPVRRWEPHAKLWARSYAENLGKGNGAARSTRKRKDCNDASIYD